MASSTVASATVTTATTTTSSAASAITSFAFNPLTTIYTAPADCSGVYESADLYLVDPSTSCLPSGFQLQSTDYFSPGIICPTGYVSACYDTTGVESITTVTCCPTQSGITLSCVDHSKSPWTSFFCTWIPDLATALAVTLSDDGQTSTSSVAFKSPGGINAFGVRMVYESTDVSTSTSILISSTLTASSTASITTTATTSASSTASITPSATTSTPTGSTRPSLSSSAVIAIAVVVPVVAILLLGSVLAWWKKMYNQHKVVHGPEIGPDELPAETIQFWGGRMKIPTTETSSELLAPVTNIPVELSTEAACDIRRQ